MQNIAVFLLLGGELTASISGNGRFSRQPENRAQNGTTPKGQSLTTTSAPVAVRIVPTMVIVPAPAHDPHGVRMRRITPVAGDPEPAAVPSPFAIDPNVFRPG